MVALDAARLGFDTTVLLEGGLIGLISWLLASLAAFPISKLMADAISQSLFGGAKNIETRLRVVSSAYYDILRTSKRKFGRNENRLGPVEPSE